MAAPKLLNEWGALIKTEASYNGGGTLSASTDGVLVQEQPDVQVGYLHDGQRRAERGPMNLGMKRLGKSGRFGEVTLVHEGAGSGSAYSASVLPSFHTLLRLAGFSATLDAGVGVEKYTYALSDGNSGVAEIYTGAEKFSLQAIYSDLGIELGEDDLVPAWSFALRGLMPTMPSEAAVPSITYPSEDPAVAESIALTFGSFAGAQVRSFALSLNREIAERADKNAAGHAGFSPGSRRPTLEVVIERDTLVGTPFHSSSGIDPYQLTDLATAIAVSLTVGSVQYKRWKISASNAQLAEPVEPQDDGPTALWRLVWELNPSTPGAKDNFTIVAD